MSDEHFETIFQTARSAGSFETLVDALTHAGLDETLSGWGPYTMFAPDDAAFGQLPAGALDSLFAEPDRLAELLRYHVVPGRMTAAEISRMRRAPTVQGEALLISCNSDVRVDAAHVTNPDLEASNGLIHVIDRVLIPAKF